MLVLSTVRKNGGNCYARRVPVLAQLRMLCVLVLGLKNMSNRPFVARIWRGMFVCASVLLMVVRSIWDVLLICVHILVLVSCSAVTFVVAVSGPFDRAFVRHMGLMGVSRLSKVVGLFRVVSGSLLLMIPLNAMRLGARLVLFVVLLIFY